MTYSITLLERLLLPALARGPIESGNQVNNGTDV